MCNSPQLVQKISSFSKCEPTMRHTKFTDMLQWPIAVEKHPIREIFRMATLSLPIPKADPQAYFLCAARMLWIAAPLVILLPLHLIWHILKLPSPWAMLFLRIAARALGARVTVHGKHLRKDVFFVANHLSWHDIPILAGITGTAFVAQDGVRNWPIIGWLAKLNRTIFVSRTDKHNVSSQVAELREGDRRKLVGYAFPRRHHIGRQGAFAVQKIAV